MNANTSEQDDLKAALLQQHEDFLAVLNHRLRTPVLAAHRIVSLLLEGQFGKLNQGQEEVVSLLNDNLAEIDRLTLMIMDIYRYRSSSKLLNMTEVEISNIVSRVFSSRKKAKIPVVFNLENNNLSLWCDEREIFNMLSHLIDNAFKYARNSIKVSVHKNDAGQCTIAVEDDGVGIAEEDINDLFDRFYVMSSKGHYAPVTGAGLCLCAEIAKAHGGKITCTSIPGKSTRFEVSLPAVVPGQTKLLYEI